MAEILGLASSIITIVGVAGKLGTSTVRLKRLWDEVQDVPESIRRCIDHLELLAPAIEDMDNEFQQTRHMVQNDNAAKRSLEYSRKAVETLETLVRDMESQITSTRKRKRFVAQFKVMVKKEVIEEHQRQLDSALQLVSLSQQTYLIALSRSQSAIMVSELKSWHESEQRKVVEQRPNAVIAIANEDTKHDSISGTSQTSPVSIHRHGNWSIPWHQPGFLGSFFYQSHEVTEDLCAPDELGNAQVHKLRLQLPRWLMQRAWDFHVLRAHNGWTIQLKAWTTRPPNAEIFKLIRDGRTDLVVKAIRDKEASIYDRSLAGWTLIDEAAGARQLGVLKALVSMGLSFADTDDFALRCELRNWALLKTDALLMEFGRALVTKEIDAKGHPFFTCEFIWNLPGYWELLFSHASARELITMIPDLKFSPMVPLELLSRGAVVPENIRNIYWFDFEKFATEYLHTFLNRRTHMEKWRLLVRKVFVGAMASEASSMKVVKTLTSFWQRQFALQPFETWIRKALGMLLEDLAIAGVDLEEYMRWEAIRSYDPSYDSDDDSDDDSGDDSDDDCSDDCYYPRSHSGSWMIDHLRLRSGMRIPASGPALVIHTTGRMPSDWAFSWDPCVEELCGEFWLSIIQQAGVDRFNGSKVTGILLDQIGELEEQSSSLGGHGGLPGGKDIEQPIPGAWVDFDPYSEQDFKYYGCLMSVRLDLCRKAWQFGGEKKLGETELLRVRGMATCQEIFPP